MSAFVTQGVDAILDLVNPTQPSPRDWPRPRPRDARDRLRRRHGPSPNIQATFAVDEEQLSKKMAGYVKPVDDVVTFFKAKWAAEFGTPA